MFDQLEQYKAKQLCPKLRLIFTQALFTFALLAVFHSPKALAQQSEMKLFVDTDSYTPGKPITVYLFMYRLQGYDPFFKNLNLRLERSPDFQLVGRPQLERLSTAREFIRGQNPFFGKELHSLFFKLRIQPLKSKNTMRFGPMYRGNVRSNQLFFQKAAPRSSLRESPIKSKVTLSSKKLQVGNLFSIKVEVKCPLKICNYQGYDPVQLQQQLKQNTKVNPDSHFWPKQRLQDIRIEYGTQNPATTTLHYHFDVTPLTAGSKSSPKIQISLPMFGTDGKMLQKVRSWLQQTKGATPQQAQQLASIQQQAKRSAQMKAISVSSQEVEVSAASACPGDWTLKSQLVTPDQGRSAQWEIRLEGTGFLLLAEKCFQQKLEQFLSKHKLTQKLSHYRTFWRLPESSLSGRVELIHLFKFKAKRVEIPAFQMEFLSSTGKKETKKTEKLTLQESLSVPNYPKTFAKKSKRIYLYHDTAPNTSSFQPIIVWAYQMDNSFPFAAVFHNNWSIDGFKKLRSEVKTKDIVLNQRRGPGVFFNSSQRYQVPVLTGNFRAKKKKSIFAKFPIVEWGGHWILTHTESSVGLSLEASVNRKKYFVGEPIDYKLVIRCPADDCPAQGRDFYKKLFKPALKLPNFDKYTGWRELEKFKRRSTQGWVTFTYKVRFRAPVVKKELEIPSTRLRLSRIILNRLMQKHQICFFRGGRGEDRIWAALAKHHYRQTGQTTCALGTQELSTASMNIPISSLPSEAQNVKLIGSFRIQARLKKLQIPQKNIALTDKPFYLEIDIAGQGDLKAARDLIREQLEVLGRKLMKQNVSTDILLPQSASLKERGIIRLQYQLIAEQPMKLKLPSIKLKYYHREEGIINAQTLPQEVTIKRSQKTKMIVAKKVTPTSSKKRRVQLLEETDLRPNHAPEPGTFVNENFLLLDWKNLGFLFASPFFFLLFLGWHRKDRTLASDPKALKTQKALRSFKQSISKLNEATPSAWSSKVLQAIQLYFSERLRLDNRQMTAYEIKQMLSEKLEQEKFDAKAKPVISKMEVLEASLYGGSQIEDQKQYSKELQNELHALDRILPQEGKK